MITVDFCEPRKRINEESLLMPMVTYTHWWRDFVKSIGGDPWSTTESQIDIVNKGLANWGGHLSGRNEYGIRYIEFEDERDATMFLLRWA